MRREWNYPVDWFCPTESCVDVCCWLLNGVVSWRCKARNSLWTSKVFRSFTVYERVKFDQTL
jgi:hypothetical protein